MRLLAFDPSGNFNEGKGTTGWSAWEDGKVFAAGQIPAKEFGTQLEYWAANINKIDEIKPDRLIMEDYRLYAHKASEQINSNLETPQLIGVLKYHCWKSDIPVTLQMAAEAKRRYPDDILEHENIIYQNKRRWYTGDGILVSNHSRDSLRHLFTYINKMNMKENNKNGRKRYKGNYSNY